ncbi:Uncharacterized protein APZ42_011657 [Daphnia magna]|uniref:Uncharacterized protein n=1 Tax=Daphnia magna TaxID=35525 RepID=A0A162SW36_9CRUS|nr:Uncharacterized protein APZ42_011657 [Daphnia magna]
MMTACYIPPIFLFRDGFSCLTNWQYLIGLPSRSKTFFGGVYLLFSFFAVLLKKKKTINFRVH